MKSLMVEAGQSNTQNRDDELFRLLAENVRDYAIFVLDRDGIVRAWPHGAERMLGYAAEEIIGQSVNLLFTPEDIAEGIPQQEMDRARQTGRGEDNRWHVRKDGTRLWAAGVMTPLFEDDGQLRGYAKIMRDRTEWKSADQARGDSEAVKAAVLETALDGIITIDHEDHVVEFNPAAERLFGYSRNEVLGRKMAELIVPPRFRPKHYQGMREYLATGYGPILGQRLKLPALRADGTEFQAEISITRVPVRGAPLFTGYIRDITDQVRQEFRRETQLAVTEILADASSLEEAAPRILKSLCETTGWEIGAFWRVESDLLKCLDTWQADRDRAIAFTAECQNFTYTRGSGLPGTAWESGKVEIVLDHPSQESESASTSQAKSPMPADFAVPIKLGSEVLAVIEFFSMHPREPDPDLLKMLETIGGSIGQFIQRKQAERGQREGEERLRRLIDNLPQGAVYRSVQDESTNAIRFTFLSAGVEQISGVTPDEGIADVNSIYRIIHDDDKERIRDEAIRALQLGEPFDLEFRIVHRSGKLCWVHCRSAPHHLLNGEVVWEGVVLDVTDRKLAESRMREQEHRLRLAFEAGKMGTWNWNLKTNEVHWSPQLDEIHGIPTGTFPGTFEAYQQDMHPDDRESILKSIYRAVETSGEHHMEYRIILPNGRLRWIEARGKVFHDDAGRPVHMLGVCTEITERRRREEDLRFLANASHSLTTLVDYESTLQKIAELAVPHFADWCTIDLPEDEEMLRQLAVAHIDPSKVQLAEEVRRNWPPDPETEKGIYEVFRTGKSVLVEEVTDDMLRAVAKSNGHFEALQSLGLTSYMCVPMAVRDHRIGVMTFMTAESGRRYTKADLALAEDLAHRAAVASENAHLYATLQEEARKKDEFLAMLAHELRNPLAPIRSGLDLLRLMGTDTDVLQTMQQQIEQLVRLVDDLLDVSRIMRGKVELRTEMVQLESIVNRAVDTVRPLTEKSRQQLTVTLPPQRVWLNADPVRLAQIIGNLLNNASKYTEAGGKIELSAHVNASSLVLRIRDTGLGISKELLPHVFDLFMQDQRSIDRSQGGLGIGLTVVKSLVEMHGGSVHVTSEGLGKGSEFCLRLPISSPSERQRAIPEAPSETPALRILLVDDNIPAARILTMLLKKLGHHEVFSAHDGQAALTAASDHAPDLILLDIGLPKLDGFEVARRLRQQPEFRQTLIVALTGYGTEEDRRRSMEAGFDEHLVKPPGIEALKHVLNRAHQEK